MSTDLESLLDQQIELIAEQNRIATEKEEIRNEINKQIANIQVREEGRIKDLDRKAEKVAEKLRELTRSIEKARKKAA